MRSNGDGENTEREAGFGIGNQVGPRQFEENVKSAGSERVTPGSEGGPWFSRRREALEGEDVIDGRHFSLRIDTDVSMQGRLPDEELRLA